MSGSYLGVTDASDGLPVISKAVVHNGIAYLCGVTAGQDGDVEQQTREVLGRIDRLLAGCGTDRSRLLTAQVWLASMADFAAHNAIWNEWVDRSHPPARACVQATLFRPELLVEIMVTASVA